MMVEEVLTEAALVRAFETALEVVPTQALQDFITQSKLNTGGMRPGKPAFMRMAVANAFRGKLLKYDALLAALVRSHLPEARLLTMLAPEALTRRRAQLTVFFGKARFILALLVDSRADVREDAARWMGESGAELPDAETAQALVREAFSPVAQAGQDGSPAGNARMRAERADLERRFEEYKKEVKRERRAAEEAAARAMREQKDQLATQTFAVAEANRRVGVLENALKREAELRALRVNELLAVRQIELFRGWLKPVLSVEALLEDAQTLPLLERAEAVLAAQRKADRASARRSEAATRLKAIEQTLQAVEETLAGAHHILPETIALREALCAQRDAFRAGLALDDELTSAVAKELAARIDATTEADYAPVRDWLRLSERLGAIGATEAKALRERFRRRATCWAATDPEFKADDVAMDAESESVAIRRRNPVFASAFAGQGEMVLFLDGHNMLNGLGRYRQRRGQPLTHEDARKRVEKDICRQFADLPLVAVHLVWDGAEKSQHNLSGNLLVHFSGGVGEHRADRYILNQIDYCKTQTSVPMVLVTDDNGFAGEAVKRGAEICRLHDFEAFLNVPLV